MSVRLGRWVMHHRTASGWLHRLIHRAGHHYHQQSTCVLCRAVWAQMEADHPDFSQDIQKGLDDYSAGRWYRLDTATGESIPNPDWPADGPQPTNWTTNA